MTVNGYVERPRRILSIQSHVASGYVGNRAATFPLQLLGWDVDVINTVQYSNHAGYGRHGGSKFDPSQLESVFTGLEQNGLLRPSRLLTGYIPGGTALTKVAELAKKLTARQDTATIYLLDPVMGDEGRLYVDADVVPIYRDILLPLATIITPNWFEVQLLTNTKLDTIGGLRTALRILHQQHRVANVVISSLMLESTSLPPSLAFGPHSTKEDFKSKNILCLCSSADSEDPRADPTVHVISVPRISGYFSGVGDIFSALVLAHYHPGCPQQAPFASKNRSNALSLATTQAVNTTHAILLETQRYYLSLPPEEQSPTDDELDAKDKDRRSRRMRSRELRLIQSADLIRKGGNAPLGDMLEWKGFWKTENTIQQRHKI